MEIKLVQRRVHETQSTGMTPIDVNLFRGEGAAMVGLGHKLAKMGESQEKKIEAAESRAKIDEAVNRYKVESDQWVNDRGANSGGYATFGKEFEEYNQEKIEEILDEINDPVVRSQVAQRLGQLTADNTIKVNHMARKQRIGYAVTASNKAMNAYTRSAVASDNAFDLERIRGEMEEFVADQKATGVYAADSKVFENYWGDVQVSRARKEISSDPEIALRRLLDPSAYQGMPEDRRATLTESARRQMEIAATKKDREEKARHSEEDRRIRILQERTHAAGIKLHREGQLTEEWLEDARQKRKVSDSDYKTLSAALDKSIKEGGVTDLPLFAEMEYQAYSGRLELNSVIGNPKLSSTDEKALIDIISEGAAFTRTPEYKEARKYIATTIGSEGGSFGPFSIKADPFAANAMREFYIRVKVAGGNNIPEILDDVITRYQKRRDGIPNRRRFPNATKDDLKKSVQNGSLSIHEYNMEVGYMEKEARRSKSKTPAAVKPNE